MNILLGVAALRRLPCQTLPWLAAYAVSMLLSMILIVVVLLFGTTKLELTYNEWVTGLALLGLLTGANFFCWIVVFTLRKNLMMEGQIERSCSTGESICTTWTREDVWWATHIQISPQSSFAALEEIRTTKVVISTKYPVLQMRACSAAACSPPRPRPHTARWRRRAGRPGGCRRRTPRQGTTR